MHSGLIMRIIWALRLIGLEVDRGRLLAVELWLSVLNHVHLLSCSSSYLAAHYAHSYGQNDQNSTTNPLSNHETPADVIFKGFEVTILKISTTLIGGAAAIGEATIITLNRLIGIVIATRLIVGAIDKDDQEGQNKHHNTEEKSEVETKLEDWILFQHLLCS